MGSFPVSFIIGDVMMEFSSDSGTFQVSKNFIISSKMNMKDILGQNVVWEEWFPRVNGIVLNYRTVIDIPNGSEKLTIIIHFNSESAGSSTIKSWLCAPTHQFYGIQKKPDGQLTKAIRKWFQSKTGVVLPVREKWGKIDAAYDPHNQTAEIVCNYYK